jgi:hypothetical protein
VIRNDEGSAVAGTSSGQPAAQQKPPVPHRGMNRLIGCEFFQDHDLMMTLLDL